MERICLQCGLPLAESVRFCPRCGAPMEAGKPEVPCCAACGKPLRPGTRFCTACGAPASASFPQQNADAYPQAGQAAPWPRQQVPAASNSPAPQEASWYSQPYPRQAATYPPQQRQAEPSSSPYPYQQGQATPQEPYPRQTAPSGQWQQPHARQTGKKRKAWFPVVAAILVVSLAVTGFWQPGFFLKKQTDEPVGSTAQNTTGKDTPKETEKPQGSKNDMLMSPENTSVTTKDGIQVDVGEFVLDGEAELTVKQGGTEDHSDEGYKIDVYDIQLGDLHELGDYITIRIPYDTTYCKPGQDPAKCVGAKYKNDATGEWEDVLFEVDAERQELVIYTDHLSYYGALYVEDEGRRNALVTDVLNSPLYMDQETTLEYARRIAAGDESVKKDLTDYVGEASDMFFDYADRLDNAINIVTQGDIPEWLDTSIPDTNQTLFSALGYLATTTNLLKIAAKDSLGGGASDGEVLNLIRDVGSKVTTYWADAFTSVGSGALSVGMGGVLIIDKMLTAFAEEAHSTKMEDITYVYHHYNEGFSATFAHKLMKPKDWREKVIQLLENNPDDPEIAITALEAGFRKYASEFFDLTADQMAEVASDVPNVTVRRIPNFTDAEKEQMIDEYVAHLKETTMPAVLKSVSVYMIRKTEEVQLQAINKIKDYYNTKITISLHENLPKDAKSALAGYKLRFAPLSDNAVKSNWTGLWPESGKITTSATLVGFMTSGYPHTVEFFKPEDDPDSAKPVFTIDFKISMPSIDIEVSAAPTFDELVGYYADGTVMISKMFVSDEFRASMASSPDHGKSEFGCDLNEMIPAMEAQVGVPKDAPITIEKTGENTGTIRLTSNEEDTFALSYDPVSGVIQVHYEADGAVLDGAIQARYTGDRTGVELAGDMEASVGSGAENFSLTLHIEGSKPLEA